MFKAAVPIPFTPLPSFQQCTIRYIFCNLQKDAAAITHRLKSFSDSASLKQNLVPSSTRTLNQIYSPSIS